MEAGAGVGDYDIEIAEGGEGFIDRPSDVIVGGVSLVTNYRDEFSDAVKSSGIDGLIATLAKKNAAGTPPTK